MRRRIVFGLLALVVLAAGSYAAASLAQPIKLPKCSAGLCRDVNCSPDTLCVQGSHVKNCADVCNGH
ncbi:MAG TPA: hypothetical protein VJS92_08350 [Candidatus Polarisedimenticolaceae bacterium]|nr:hypothetical protein [Candidatus Polarisedimenticolaceae bacterium]